ncbi:AzlD family protein [Shewanella avicenniae]|uniref:AzlD family protein n=1 Tax=Shewanella avicenniae TaxID=2814294 RepID=A0ABX7QRE2_9GAMM|nr:AzlD family protein [Shewanella avicenniae]QSX33275.1 AzlD family protein [Shewanella avicenniae]
MNPLENLVMQHLAVLTILAMGITTYLTRIIGYLALRNRSLNPRLERVMEVVPGCVLISVIAPVIFSGHITDIIAVAITFVAMLRFSLLPTVIIAIVATGLLRHWLG